MASLASLAACDRADRASLPPVASASSAPPAPSAGAAPLLAADAAAFIHCQPDATFPPVLAVPEASGAAIAQLRPGVEELLVASDSDRRGAALAYTLPDGPARALSLPLDIDVTDDVEGIAWFSGHLYAIVSTGYIERFAPTSEGELRRDQDAYAVGAPPFTAIHPTYAWGQPPDFEGLCIRPGAKRPSAPPQACAAYAASRAFGWLVCLVFEGDRLRVNPDHPRLALDVKSHSLSDCAFGEAGGPAESDLLVTTNIRGGSTVYRVDEETGALTPIDIEGTINNEAIAVDRAGRLYQLTDANSATSPAVRALCTGW